MGTAFKLDSKGRTVIPQDLRTSAHIEEGAMLYGSVDENGRLVIETRESLKRSLRAQLAPAMGGESAVDSLLCDRRAEVDTDAGVPEE